LILSKPVTATAVPPVAYDVSVMSTRAIFSVPLSFRSQIFVAVTAIGGCSYARVGRIAC
jgi:hypothetical protein